MKHWMKWVAGVAAIVVGAWVIATLLGVVAAQQESKEDRAELEQQVDDLEQQARKDRTLAEALQQQIRSLGEDPVVEPNEVPDDADVIVIAGQKGDRGERGASCIEQIGYPRCRGAAGDDSTTPGPPGAQSTVPGPKGDKGDPGADGRDGTDGKDGRGIADQQCGDDGRWTVTYTDGTTSDAGLCRVAPGNSGENR